MGRYSWLVLGSSHYQSSKGRDQKRASWESQHHGTLDGSSEDAAHLHPSSTTQQLTGTFPTCPSPGSTTSPHGGEGTTHYLLLHPLHDGQHIGQALVRPIGANAQADFARVLVRQVRLIDAEDGVSRCQRHAIKEGRCLGIDRRDRRGDGGKRSGRHGRGGLWWRRVRCHAGLDRRRQRESGRHNRGAQGEEQDAAAAAWTATMKRKRQAVTAAAGSGSGRIGAWGWCFHRTKVTQGTR